MYTNSKHSEGKTLRETTTGTTVSIVPWDKPKQGSKDLSMENLRALKKMERKTLEDSASHAKASGELVL